jgi:acyl carrier protein
MEEKIREIIDAHARLSLAASGLTADDDLYTAGMSSQSSVNVMLAIEDTFDVEFPDHMLKRSTFASISSISSAVAELQSATTA